MRTRALLGYLALASSLAAQDVTVSEPVWFLPGPPPTEVPKLKGRFRPDFPASLRETSEPGYVIVTRHVDPKGAPSVKRLLGTEVPYQRAVEEEMVGKQMTAARRDGKPIEGRVWFAVIFNPKSADARKPDATPRLLQVAPVITERSPTPRGTPPVVRMIAEIDAAGGIASVRPDHDIDADMLDSIKRSLGEWKIAPARKAGIPVAATMRLAVICQPPIRENAAAEIPAKLKKSVPPEYPVQLRRARFRGEVRVGFVVDVDGTVQNPVVISSSNPLLSDPALAAVAKWTFEPATRDGAPVRSRLIVPVKFDLSGGSEQYKVGAGRNKELPEALQYDSPPKIRGVVLPVHPYALRLEKTKGSALAVILIDERGRVYGVEIAESTHPEFAAALVAAAETFSFDPATRDGKVVESAIRHEQKFDSFALRDGAVDKYVALERDHPERIVSAAKLDERPTPVSRHLPVFPRALIRKGETTGEAVVGILIDEDGDVRLPRIMSATDEAFGYAAVQAISQWKFKPPQAGGKRVVTRVHVPFKFELHEDEKRP